MRNFFLRSGIIVFFLGFVFTLAAFASCEECEVTKSCETYQECMAAKLNCVAACKEKEAAEITAKSSEKMIETQERTIATLREIFVMAQRTAELLKELTLKISEKQ
ncbi:MAG: hypothetical protein NTY14_04560 [Candidatus Omnitrophica bacterium]|nr:hypothetical protein [Candidatus Omnitrophota bacterium]